MHDEVDIVEQHPPSLLHAFDVIDGGPLFLQLRHHMLRDTTDMDVRSSAGDDEEIRHIRDGLKIEDHDVLGLTVETEGGGAPRGRFGLRHANP